MSDNDFVIVDPSTLELASRKGRGQAKPKYKHELWNKDDERSQQLYYETLQSSYKRRHGDTETPYDHLIDRRKNYTKWWSENSIHLISIEQIRLEDEDRYSTKIGDMLVCRYCNGLYDGNEAVYSWVCMDCMETEDYLKDM